MTEDENNEMKIMLRNIRPALKEFASHLFFLKEELVESGFSENQAMQIVCEHAKLINGK